MRNRNLVLLVVIVAVVRSSHASEAFPSALKVSDNGRYLVTADGQPFFWMGDTAWRFIQKASRTDVEDQPSALRYFEKRSAQGFNVIQTVLVSVDIPANAAGHSPFVDGDFSRPRVLPGPDNDFWDDVDWFVDQAAAHGLYLALLPTWNSSVPEDHPMVGDPAIAYRYGHFLGTQYRDRSNIIWVLGGDPPPPRDVGVPERLAMIRAMAEGLADGVNGFDQQDGKADWTSTLMTYHPRGGGQSSSKHLHAEPWLDFNMIQTTTRFEFANHETVAADYALQPPKPTLDAEVAYEDSLSLNRKEPQDRRITPRDVRRAAYWSVFAGSFGHTYGHRSFIAWMRKDETYKWGAHIPWYESLDAPGANQMSHLRTLMESNSLIDHAPDASLLADAGPRGKGHLQATRASDGSAVLVYSPLGKPIPMQLDKFTTGPVVTSWFDPRTGESTRCGTFELQAKKIFEPPSNGEDQDWVLVLKRQ